MGRLFRALCFRTALVNQSHPRHELQSTGHLPQVLTRHGGVVLLALWGATWQLDDVTHFA